MATGELLTTRSPDVETVTTAARDADRRLAEQDVGLPGLGLALDAERLTALVLPTLIERGMEADEAHVSYLRWKPGTSLTASLDLVTHRPGRSHPRVEPVLLRSWSAERGPSRLREQDRFEPLALDRWQSVVAPAEAERGLRVAQARRRGWQLDPEGEPRWRIRPLRYRPGRRWVARLDDDQGVPRILLKALTVAGASTITTAASHALEVGARVNPLVGADPRHGLVATRWVSGRTIRGEGKGYRRDVTEVGEALAVLHLATPPGLPLLDRRVAPLARCQEALAVLQRLLPDHGELLAEVAWAVAAAATRTAGAEVSPVLSHGDLNAEQVLHATQGAVLLDLDRSEPVDPLADVASWLAHDGGDLSRGEPLLAGLAAGGAEVEDLSWLGFLTAAALLQRAVEPFRHRHPDWPTPTLERVHRALALVSG